MGRQKIFCIGRNKTGTTSLAKAFRDLGYPVGDQRRAEEIADRDYFRGEFQNIVRYCKSARVFQDIPFSWPDTYRYLDQAYPRSKFILTIRDDPEQWYQSITRYHAKLFGRNNEIPTAQDLRDAPYVRKGFMYNTVRIHGTRDELPYCKETMIAHYIKYNREVIEFFKGRESQLLVLNIAEDAAYDRFASFLGIDAVRTGFPWENRT